MEEGCICHGNWRAIIKEVSPFFDKVFVDKGGQEYHFLGVLHAEEDYYYAMHSMDNGGHFVWLSCVGDLEGHGFTLKEGQL